MNISSINKMGFNGYCSVCGRVTIRKGKLKSRQYTATYQVHLDVQLSKINVFTKVKTSKYLSKDVHFVYLCIHNLCY